MGVMKKFSFPDSFLYRQRYKIGYTLVALALVATILFISIYLPGGITNAEVQSTIHSSNLSLKQWWTLNIINLPYYLIQKAGFALLGVTILTIKLPSMILSILSAFGLVLLLRKWFKSNVAVLASLIAITTGQFLFVAQNGTPDIMFIFWPVWLLLLATLISEHSKYSMAYTTIFCVMMALSLYTPLGIYPLIIFIAVTLIHPHLRHTLRKIPKHKFLPGLLIAAIIAAPLVFFASKSTSTIAALFGIPSVLDLRSNLAILGNEYFNFMGSSATLAITPFFELGSSLLIILGIYRVFQTRATAKSYVTLLWSICLIPLIILNPRYTNASFLPLVLLLAAGINWLLTYWYQLFPRNPYARIAGLIPMVVLVTALVFSGVSRYVYGYKYDPNLTYSFSNDIQLIPRDTRFVVVGTDELNFYRVLQKYNNNFSVSTKPTGGDFLATRQAFQNDDFKKFRITRVITNSNSRDADRFYIYSK